MLNDIAVLRSMLLLDGIDQLVRGRKQNSLQQDTYFKFKLNYRYNNIVVIYIATYYRQLFADSKMKRKENFCEKLTVIRRLVQ